MLAGTLAMSSLPGSRSVKKWKPTAPPIIKSLSTTWRQLESISKKLGNNPPVERRLSV
jgi:phage terminase small subunit